MTARSIAALWLAALVTPLMAQTSAPAPASHRAAPPTPAPAASASAPAASVAAPPAHAAAAPTALPAAPATIPLGSRVGVTASGYDDGGRRDPFVSLVATKKATGAVAGAPARPRTGLAAIALADVTVRGIVKSGASMIAILEAPGSKSFVARPKDRLLDASIQSIDASGVVFAETADGSGPAPQVRKVLRSAAEDVQ